MFVFTFTFFMIVFQAINNDSFKVLDEYPSFENERDRQLTNFSVDVESYYYSLVFAFVFVFYCVFLLLEQIESVLHTFVEMKNNEINGMPNKIK